MSEAGAPTAGLLWRCNVIGRMILWSVTLTLKLGLLLGIAAALWLVIPEARAPWLECVVRWLLGCTMGCGFLAFVLLFVVHRFFVPPHDFFARPLAGAKVHVALTAFNDESSVGAAVKEFKTCPEVHRVIVVENNSTDRTREEAAGAHEVVTEMRLGYGACCMRALAEAAKGLADGDVIVLCEGDMTFSGADLKKLLAYLENCDLVLGTRATQELREAATQMDWLINPANQVVAKLIQSRFWGVRLTDVGCTYRAMRVGSYRRLAGKLRVNGNHFSPHMFIEALKLRMRVIEIPVVFRKRWGLSKGVGSNKLKAARVAVKMLWLLYSA